MRRSVAGLIVLGVLWLLAGSAVARSAERALLPGHVLRAAVPGFAADATVSLRLAGTAATLSARADSDGVVRVRYRVPSRTGRYRLLVVGPPARDRRGHGGTVVVRVPKIVLIAFRVVSGHGVEGTSGHTGSDAGDGTAATGVDVRLLVLLGAGLIGPGAATLALTRSASDQLTMTGSSSRPYTNDNSR